MTRTSTTTVAAATSCASIWKKTVTVLIIALCCVIAVGQASTNRDILVINEAGVAAEVHWIDSSSRNTVLLSDNGGIRDGGQIPLNSFVGHEFEVREMPSPQTGECDNEDKVCRTAHFIVSDSEDQVIRIIPGLELMFTDSLTLAKADAADVIGSCKETAHRTLQALNSPDAALQVMDQLAACIQVGVTRKLVTKNEEISFQAKVRTTIAAELENYTCVDDSLDSSPDVSTHEWVMPDATRLVHVKHDRPSSQVHVVENFISEDECVAMETEAARTLHRATVADGKGGSQLSKNRKAMQAGIKVQWDKEAEGDLIARLSRRVYDYTENVLKLGIKEHGQEDLMSIQYFGRGRNDTEPDRYTPHCDGDCTGLPHKPGTRMATMVMYCTLPTEGGATNFRNSAVHIKPVKGNAIFFSYINPETKTMDTGFTEHSGCPVYEGEKKIVTQWIRLGVDDENPWDSFNTLGIKISEEEDQ